MSLLINIKKIKKSAAVMLITAVFFSCSGSKKDQTEKTNSEKFFDLPSFFQKEIDSLSSINPDIHKTIMKDEIEESKTLKIKDWKIELSSFQAIDLNKPAYQGFVKVDTTNSVVQYSFTNPKLDLACVRIKLNAQGQPELISIEKEVRNNLYNTSEFLVYEKNKFYLVEKNQKVKVLGSNYYKVQGEF